jgi:hypothetical protein
VPGLAVVIVGSRKDSQTYVNMKRKACAEVGIRSVDVDLPEDISEVALVAEVHQLNADPSVHGTASLLPSLVRTGKKITRRSGVASGAHQLCLGRLKRSQSACAVNWYLVTVDES